MTSGKTYQDSQFVDDENEKRPLKYSAGGSSNISDNIQPIYDADNSQELQYMSNDSNLQPSVSPSPNIPQDMHEKAANNYEKMHKNQKRLSNENTEIEIAIADDSDVELDNDISNDIVLMYDGNNHLKRFLSILDSYDKHFSLYIHTWSPWKIIDVFFLIPTFLFSFVGIFLVTLVYAYFLHTLSYFIYAVITLIISESIKCVIHRPRPDVNTFAGVIRIVNLSGVLIARASTSMPSGDTMQAAVLIICLRYVSKSFSYWYLMLIPLVGFGRVYFQKHYFGDVIVGGILGIFLGFVLNIALDSFINQLHI